ncbi:MAG: Recombination protein RecR [Candidatus Nomurabacteria bacterium GW2011_GWA1_36_15]|uniref:Recombination protein RecR n=1 Tax=Candidatus Nomurabacteria bacterium GW2011_GWA1_36_15 TaxID=1618728 RepID=A0A0G0DWD0_9BACT|nr:MAG: Recombination protein RecR [Candidatus Nomurabacteria bacterium GW2011_GWA1_36_15]
MNVIEKLTEIFKEFPGIGERQAKRFVYFLMSKNGEYPENLSALIKELKKDTVQCSECFKFFISASKKEKKCEICADPNIDFSTLMIVEKDSDLESVNKSRIYNGKYFILGGLVPIVEKNTSSRVRINELIKKIKNEKKGNHTDFYVRNQLKSTIEPLSIKISSLGKGLSTGTELEYSDNDTLKNALKNRQ